MLRELVDIAKEINTDIYTEQSANAFKEALEEAEAVLANENALQDELDAAHKKLQEAMDGLKVIPVDKSQLRKLVDDSRKYVEKLNEYTAQSGQIFMGAFEAAENILDKRGSGSGVCKSSQCSLWIEVDTEQRKTGRIDPKCRTDRCEALHRRKRRKLHVGISESKRGICRRGRNESGSRRCRTGTCKSNRRIEIKRSRKRRQRKECRRC